MQSPRLLSWPQLQSTKVVLVLSYHNQVNPCILDFKTDGGQSEPRGIANTVLIMGGGVTSKVRILYVACELTSSAALADGYTGKTVLCLRDGSGQ